MSALSVAMDMPETPNDLATMSWERAQTALAAADGVVLPLGSIEQHSLHLPVSVDTLRAEHLTAELVDAAPEHDLQLVRLPTLPYGYSEHHMQYPGTLTLSPATYREVLTDIGQSLARHDVDRLVMINCHGGNREPMKLATDTLQRETALRVHPIHWTEFATEYLEEAFGEGWGHAGDHETSVIEHYRPDLVRTAEKTPQTVSEDPKTTTYAYFDELTDEGGLGDPTNADPAKIEAIIEQTTADILTALSEDIAAGW